MATDKDGNEIVEETPVIDVGGQLPISDELLDKLDFVKEDEEEEKEIKDEVNLDDFTEKQIIELQDKEESDLTDEDKKVLDAVKKAEDDKSEEEEEEEESSILDDLTDEEIEEIENKEEKDLTDKDKEVLEALDKSEEDTSIIGTLRDAIPIEALESKEYENTGEGVREWAEDTAQELAKDHVAAIYEQYPVMAALYQHHVVDGKSAETFLAKTQKADFEQIDRKTEDGQKEIIQLYYQGKNLGKEEIDLLIEKIEEGGKLKDRSKSVFEDLKTEKDIVIAENEKLEQKQINDNKELIVQEKKNVAGILKSGKLLGISLTDVELKDFGKWLYSTGDDGRTPKRVIAEEELSLEKKLFMAYFAMKKGKLRGLEASEAKKRNLGNLENQNNRRSNNKENKRNKKEKELDISNLSINEILGIKN